MEGVMISDNVTITPRLSPLTQKEKTKSYYNTVERYSAR